MTKHLLLRQATRVDIDERVERILRGLGNPEPPLRLGDVRELLKLDLGYYTANDPGLAREAISRVRVAAIQVFKRPTLIIDAIKKFSLKALYLPDRRRILLDQNEPPLKHRWNEAHEIGHSIIPWHGDLMHGDNAQTLSRGCEEQVESEANFAAGRLLFFCEKFVGEARSSPLNIHAIKALNKRYGNTLASTLWRYVEAADDSLPMVGLMTCHPHPSREPADFDPQKPCKHFIQSIAFQNRFGKISEIALFGALRSYCGNQSGGPIGQSELVLTDDNGENHLFAFETFFNRHDALTLGVYLRKEPTVFAQRFV